MTYLLFFLSIGLATALALVTKNLQHLNNKRGVDRQRLEEADRQLQEADRKYGGIISKKVAEATDDRKTLARER